jgi:hypothetical protein
MPIIEDLIDTFSGSKFFSILDAQSGYLQIPIAEADIGKTAFSCKFGHFEFLRMPFGLVNGPASYQRCMDFIFQNQLNKFVVVYIDDIIVFSLDLDNHKQHLETVFDLLSEFNVKLNPAKCSLFNTKLKILGHEISESGVQLDRERLEAIEKIEIPATLKRLHSFLGLVSYCRKFIKDLAKISEPFYQEIKRQNSTSTQKVILNKKIVQAFSEIKSAIKENLCLALPSREKAHTFILTTDASDTSIGATLSQKQSANHERLIACYSKTLGDAQRRYSATEKELVAVIESIKRFRHLLLGNSFILRTDHKPILFLFKTRNLNSKMMRWALFLQEYCFDIEYLKGRPNYADIISRPSETQKIEAISTAKQRKIQQKEHVISDEEKQSIISFYHTITAHGKHKTMKHHICLKYYWKTIMNLDINRFLAECVICQKAQHLTVKNLPTALHANEENERWQIDTCGPLPLSNGYKYLLTCIDTFTKYLSVQPLESKTANDIITGLEKIFRRRNAQPKILHSQTTVMNF